ncbi:hypothetical protein GALL_401070 [mine drainage metagenome]|uniref:Uncharacterized protein n=1 Tax=mine drainage metagenome TaxID=410659 RepID=A0A1J5QE14_9ZZZZ
MWELGDRMGSTAPAWVDVECGITIPPSTGGPDRPRSRFRNPKPSGASPIRLRSGSSRVLAFPHAQGGIPFDKLRAFGVTPHCYDAD